ncbi:MAG: hypothetical protein KAR79_01525 [Simkaniaceae bacterium]|nr:hypothetical protein [Simkaniaceae bacterium]
MRNLKLVFLCLILSIKLCSYEITAKELFLSPLSKETPKENSLDMIFCLGDKQHFRFKTSPHDIYYEVIFQEKLPKCLSRKTKKLFIKDNSRFIHTYRYNALGKLAINKIYDERTWKHSIDYSYTAEKRRILEKQNPKKITVPELKNIFETKVTLFYTGAGISNAAGVPTMNDLIQLMELGAREGFVKSLDRILAQPEKLSLSIRSFHKSCFESAPTPAHFALVKLLENKQTKLLTENLDNLHEKSGITPYRISSDYLAKQVDPKDIQEVDYIICIGLSFDDKGFLGWYKKHHSNGKIISIDLIKPSYLGSEDFFLEGDLQQILPELMQESLKTG